MSLAVPFRPVGRPKNEARLLTPDDTTRVPARISTAMHDALRELCLIRLNRPIEVVIGEWLEERIPAEAKAHGITVAKPKR